MAATRIALDANILVLLAVGSVDKGALGRKRRVKEYVPEDYDLAVSVISGFRQAVVTTNVITECSDLLSDTSADGRDCYQRIGFARFVKSIVVFICISAKSAGMKSIPRGF